MQSYPVRTPVLLSLLAAPVLLSLAARPAQAQILMTGFSPATATVMQGVTEVDYAGSFTNLTSTDYYVTTATFNTPSTGSNPGTLQGFFNGDAVNGDPITGAFLVSAGSADTVPSVFSFFPDPNQAVGTYQGTVLFGGLTAVQYAADPNQAATSLGSAGITLNVTSNAPPTVPEASTSISLGLLFALGLGGFIAHKRRPGASVA